MLVVEMWFSCLVYGNIKKTILFIKIVFNLKKNAKHLFKSIVFLYILIFLYPPYITVLSTAT